jgi:hypothetical protein
MGSGLGTMLMLAMGVAAVALVAWTIDVVFLQRKPSAWPGQKPKVSVLRQRRRRP